MDISYIGHSSFRIRTKSATIITDPYTTDGTGAEYPKKLVVDMVTISHNHTDHNNAKAIAEKPFIVSGPGEYEIKGVGIVGMSVFHDNQGGALRGKNTIYRFDADGVSFAHLGDLGHVLTKADAEHLEGIDVLFVPVGSDTSLNPKLAHDVVKAISPSIVIPMHYKRKGFETGVFDKLIPVHDFLELLGVSDVVPVQKFSVTKETLPEEMVTVLFE